MGDPCDPEIRSWWYKKIWWIRRAPFALPWDSKTYGEYRGSLVVAERHYMHDRFIAKHKSSSSSIAILQGRLNFKCTPRHHDMRARAVGGGCYIWNCPCDYSRIKIWLNLHLSYIKRPIRHSIFKNLILEDSIFTVEKGRVSKRKDFVESLLSIFRAFNERLGIHLGGRWFLQRLCLARFNGKQP